MNWLDPFHQAIVGNNYVGVDDNQKAENYRLRPRKDNGGSRSNTKDR